MLKSVAILYGWVIGMIVVAYGSATSIFKLGEWLSKKRVEKRKAQKQWKSKLDKAKQYKYRNKVKKDGAIEAEVIYL